MNWLNLQVSIIRAPEYVGSEPVQRATWLNLLAYSAEHENAGRIVGARKWKDRQWQQTCGVTHAEVEAVSDLLQWEGDDLVVWGYPVEREAEVRAKREGGRKGGIRSGEVRSYEPEAEFEAHDEAARKDSCEAPSKHDRSSASRTPSTEGKGREEEGQRNGKGKEAEGTGGIQPEGETVKVPAVLNTPAFRKAWGVWLAYRSERRLPKPKLISATAMFRDLSEWGHDEAILAINHSISKNYQGIFQPSGKANGHTVSAAPKTFIAPPPGPPEEE